MVKHAAHQAKKPHTRVNKNSWLSHRLYLHLESWRSNRGTGGEGALKAAGEQHLEATGYACTHSRQTNLSASCLNNRHALKNLLLFLTSRTQHRRRPSIKEDAATQTDSNSCSREPSQGVQVTQEEH